jgi:hypothetical protein
LAGAVSLNSSLIKKFTAALFICSSFLLTGCARSAGAAIVAEENAQVELTPINWIEPYWMPIVRQANEDFADAWIECLAGHGAVAQRFIGNGATGQVLTQDENRQFDSSQSESFWRAGDLCYPLISPPAHHPQPPYYRDLPRTWEAYQRMLDVRNCLLAHGFNIPEAPPLDRWQVSPRPWNPWNPEPHSMNYNFQAMLSESELWALMNACPQDGTSFPIIFVP